jgi:radical SAM superfamily enzyme YgiQ (UPF0313 family)
VNVLLLSTYELGHQPIGLALTAAFLERAGFAPVCRDLAVDRLDEEEVRAARLVGISVPMHTALRLGRRVARRVRELNPGAHILFYGLYARLGAADADSTITGEVEEAVVALARTLASGGSVDAAPPPVLRRLPMVPPARDGLPALTRYASLAVGDERRPAGYVEATRGCKHLCRHCPIPTVYAGRFFAVPVEVIEADLRDQLARGARHITFGDPDFLNGPRHALAVARALHAIDPTVTFDMTAKVEHLLAQAALLPELASLGLIFIVSAVESFSDQVLQILDKGHTRDQVGRALALVRGAGISFRPTFLPFTPWTTLADHRELLDTLAAWELEDEVEPVQLALRLLIPPGSLLLERPELVPHLGPLDEERLTYRWTHPDPRMDQLQVASAALVERATTAGEPAAQTFAALRRLTATVEAGWVPHAHPPHDVHKATPPRLTEPWFC